MLKNISLIIACLFSLLTIYLLYDEFKKDKLSKRKFIVITIMMGGSAIGAMILMLI